MELCVEAASSCRDIRGVPDMEAAPGRGARGPRLWRLGSCGSAASMPNPVVI